MLHIVLHNINIIYNWPIYRGPDFTRGARIEYRNLFLIKSIINSDVRCSCAVCGLVRFSFCACSVRCEFTAKYGARREVAGLRVGSTTRPVLAPSVACTAPAGPPVEEKKQAVSPSPFFSLLLSLLSSTTCPQSTPKRSAIKTISARQARLCVVSGAFSV
jgi:hypothetical protein